jgi:predicted dehydrogenase
LRFHRKFYFFWDYSGGMISAWAVHLFDIVMWAMGSELHSVDTIGGQFVHDDARDTPDTGTAVFECPGYDLHYSMRHGNNRRPHGDRDHGIQFFGTKATLQINRRGFEIHDEGAKDRQKPRYTEKKEQDSSRLHKRRFLDCIRGKAKPLCDAETGHLASIYGHLANIAYRVGRRVRWDAKTESIIDDTEAAKLLGRVYREPWHL